MPSLGERGEDELIPSLGPAGASDGQSREQWQGTIASCGQAFAKQKASTQRPVPGLLHSLCWGWDLTNPQDGCSLCGSQVCCKWERNSTCMNPLLGQGGARPRAAERWGVAKQEPEQPSGQAGGEQVPWSSECHYGLDKQEGLCVHWSLLLPQSSGGHQLGEERWTGAGMLCR